MHKMDNAIKMNKQDLHHTEILIPLKLVCSTFMKQNKHTYRKMIKYLNFLPDTDVFS